MECFDLISGKPVLPAFSGLKAEKRKSDGLIFQWKRRFFQQIHGSSIWTNTGFPVKMGIPRVGEFHSPMKMHGWPALVGNSPI